MAEKAMIYAEVACTTTNAALAATEGRMIGGSLTAARPVMVEESNYSGKEVEQVDEDGEVAMEGEALSSGRAAAIAAPLRIKERGAKVVALHNGGRICRG